MGQHPQNSKDRPVCPLTCRPHSVVRRPSRAHTRVAQPPGRRARPTKNLPPTVQRWRPHASPNVWRGSQYPGPTLPPRSGSERRQCYRRPVSRSARWLTHSPRRRPSTRSPRLARMCGRPLRGTDWRSAEVGVQPWRRLGTHFWATRLNLLLLQSEQVAGVDGGAVADRGRCE